MKKIQLSDRLDRTNNGTNNGTDTKKGFTARVKNLGQKVALAATLATGVTTTTGCDDNTEHLSEIRENEEAAREKAFKEREAEFIANPTLDNLNRWARNTPNAVGAKLADEMEVLNVGAILMRNENKIPEELLSKYVNLLILNTDASILVNIYFNEVVQSLITKNRLSQEAVNKYFAAHHSFITERYFRNHVNTYNFKTTNTLPRGMSLTEQDNIRSGNLDLEKESKLMEAMFSMLNTENQVLLNNFRTSIGLAPLNTTVSNVEQEK